MKHYLVTGGCGFIGSHLTYALASNGNKVTILDDLSGGYATNCSPEATLVQGSILDMPLLNSLMAEVDGCFHLAAITSTQRCHEEWEWAHTINATGTIHIFSQARQRQIPVVYASSAAVYGPQPDLPIKETTLMHPISSYGCDKYYCELQARIADLIHNVPTLGIRFFNVYGPLQDPLSPYSGVISTFIHRAINQKDLVIHGNGHQVRDFLYINDAVTVLLAAMEKLQIEKAGHYIVNACTGEETSVEALAHHIIGLTGSQVKCLYRKSRKGDIYESIGDPSFLKETLGVNAQTSIVGGLMQTLAWMKGSLALRKHIRDKLPFKRDFDELRELGKTLMSLFLVFLMSSPVSAATAIQSPKWAVLYKTDVDSYDLDNIKDYSVLVLQPNNTLPLSTLKTQGKALLGYLSLSEVYKEDPFFAQLQSAGLLVEENPNWPGTYLVDFRSKEWIQHLLTEKIPRLIQEGFTGIFIDTVDDVVELERLSKYEGATQAAIQLIKAIRQAYPELTLMMNRGYKVLPFIAKDIDSVVGESLLTTYDFHRKAYQFVAEGDHQTQLTMLKTAQKENPKLAVYTLDYWDPQDAQGLKTIYQQERAQGFNPYVATINLDQIVKEPEI